MQCPTCGTNNTRVLDTRTEDGGTIIKRRHECGNLHRYNTFQIHETTARTVGLAQLRKICTTTTAGITRRATSSLLRRRAEKLLANGASPNEVGATLGVTPERIRQIRRAVQNNNNS